MAAHISDGDFAILKEQFLLAGLRCVDDAGLRLPVRIDHELAHRLLFDALAQAVFDATDGATDYDLILGVKA